jgi:hypothetical protein
MKKIIISFDGTGNEASDAQQENTRLGFGELEDSSISNVLKLHLLFGGNLKDTSRIPGQTCLYYSGVGTYGSKIKRAFNSALGLQNLDVDRIQKEAQDDLEKIYEPGDELFLFGFSRGAAMARQFASRYVSKIISDQDHPVKFMGVFDTVAAIGIPNLDNNELSVSDVVFEDRKVSSTVVKALHLVSLDEKRKAFLPTLMNKEDRVKEIWFSGVHSDIGGGFRRDGLSDITLEYMLRYIREMELGIQLIYPHDIDYESLLPKEESYKVDFDDVMMNPNPFAPIHQKKRSYLISKLTLGNRSLNVIDNDKNCDDLPIVHHTVAERIYGDAEYKPQSLVQEKHYILMPDGTLEAFNGGLKEHRTLGRAALIELEVNQTQVIKVHANRLFNPSGIYLKTGQKYCFIVDFIQQWYDSSVSATPRGWDVDDADVDLGWLKEIIIRRKEEDRRVPSANWFEVCGTLGTNEDSHFRVLHHLENSDADLEPETNSELFLFANDLKSRYGNNLGFIDVTVKRTF